MAPNPRLRRGCQIRIPDFGPRRSTGTLTFSGPPGLPTKEVRYRWRSRLSRGERVCCGGSNPPEARHVAQTHPDRARARGDGARRQGRLPQGQPSTLTRISHLDPADRPEGRGNAGETADSLFHPSRPSGLGYLIWSKALTCQPKLVQGSGQTPIHLGIRACIIAEVWEAPGCGWSCSEALAWLTRRASACLGPPRLWSRPESLRGAHPVLLRHE